MAIIVSSSFDGVLVEEEFSIDNPHQEAQKTQEVENKTEEVNTDKEEVKNKTEEVNTDKEEKLEDNSKTEENTNKEEEENKDVEDDDLSYLDKSEENEENEEVSTNEESVNKEENTNKEQKEVKKPSINYVEEFKMEKPNPEDFEDDPLGYQEKLVEYQLRKIEHERKVEEFKKQIEERAIEKLNTFKTRADKAKVKYGKEWEELKKNEPLLPLVVQEEIIESEYGPDMLFYLFKNKDVYNKLTEMEPRKQVKELVLLEQKLAKKLGAKGTATEDAKIKVKPAPAKSVKAVAEKVLKTEELDVDDYMRMREEQDRKNMK